MAKALQKVEVTEPKKNGRTCHWLKPYQFKKGESGNPKGPGKGMKISLRAILRNSLERKGYKPAIKVMEGRGVDINDGTHADLIAAVLLWKAEHGDMDAIKEVIKCTERPLHALSGLFPDDDPENPEDRSINVTVKVVQSITNNVQNNINLAQGKRELKE